MIANHTRARGLALSALAAIALALGLIAGPPMSMAGDVKPFTMTIPTVTGPIPSTSTSYAFIADGFDVMPPVPPGYVEEEFLRKQSSIPRARE